MPSTRLFPTPKTPEGILRFLELITFPVAFILLLVHGIVSGIPVPALGIIPMFGAAVLAAVLLYRDKVVALGSPIQVLTESNVFLADLAIAVLSFVLLVPTWATLGNPWDRGLIVLGTYGSVFLMATCGIHTYLFLNQARKIFQLNSGCECDHCESLRRRGAAGAHTHEFTPLTVEYDELDDVEQGLHGILGEEQRPQMGAPSPTAR